jgi:DNA invertase Pin-like site-specific DNA recombinase
MIWLNDRLLLGLKDAMSEAELHCLKARMLEARLAKVRRGELGRAVPMGYVRPRYWRDCN